MLYGISGLAFFWLVKCSIQHCRWRYTNFCCNCNCERGKLSSQMECKRQIYITDWHIEQQIWMNQELAECSYIGTGQRFRFHSSGGSTFLHEMMSWPPSWKCEVKSKNPTPSINASLLDVHSYQLSSWLDLKWQRRPLKRLSQQEQEEQEQDE